MRTGHYHNLESGRIGFSGYGKYGEDKPESSFGELGEVKSNGSTMVRFGLVADIHPGCVRRSAANDCYEPRADTIGPHSEVLTVFVR